MRREHDTNPESRQESRDSTEHTPRPEPSDRSLGELFADLSQETGELIQQEIALVKAEMSQKLTRMRRGALLLALGAPLAYAGLLGLMAAAIAALAKAGLPLWASTLLIGGGFVILGSLLIGGGVAALRHIDPTPRQTLETLQEDKEWMRQQKSGK